MLLTPPMSMMAFFRKSEGTWFTQRTVHHFDVVADESGESNLIVGLVAASDQRVIEICKSQGIDSALATGGASFAWQANLSDSAPSSSAAVLVDVPDDESGLSGKLVRDRGYVETIPVVSRYWFGQDGVLTIDTDYETNQGQERCWFLTDDFRVRVSTARMMNGVNLMTYCSEKRFITPEDVAKIAAQHATP
ncbi:MAG: phycobiliprotein lyase [Phormidesmis priestleyi]|uniref:Chromophore lyase CpcS/CpeS n=1 Tax=Phormidesmis priestleyi TaxID=268141 RepID=A0A2W4X9U4_9CYAN|nr:MAG: phycobiliprotein lyase [Phormidesmis priestleyi]